MTCESVNVLTIERRHESSVDPVDRIVCEVIRFMLERLYLGDVLVELVRVLEQLVQQSRRARKLGRDLSEKCIELVVARNELQSWTPGQLTGSTAGFPAGVESTAPRLGAGSH